MADISEGAYVVVVEYFLLDLLAVAFLFMKQSMGTFPVLYTVYVIAITLTYVLVLVVIVFTRTQRPHHFASGRLAQLLQVSLHFNVALTVVSVCFLVLAFIAKDNPTGNQDRLLVLLVYTSLQQPESQWVLGFGLLVALALALVLLVLSLFMTTSLRRAIFDGHSSHTKSSSATNCLWQTIITVASLGLFVQMTLCIQVQDICRHTDGKAKCDLEQFSLSTDKVPTASELVAWLEALAVSYNTAAGAAPGSYQAQAYAAIELMLSGMATMASETVTHGRSVSNFIDKYGMAFIVVFFLPALHVAVWLILLAWNVWLPFRLKHMRSRDQLRTKMLCAGVLLGYGLHLYFFDDCTHKLFRIYNYVVGGILVLSAVLCVISVNNDKEEEETELVEEDKKPTLPKADFAPYKESLARQERPCLMGTQQPNRPKVYLKSKKS